MILFSITTDDVAQIDDKTSIMCFLLNLMIQHMNAEPEERTANHSFHNYSQLTIRQSNSDTW